MNNTRVYNQLRGRINGGFIVIDDTKKHDNVSIEVVE
jgi:hypothetical protein